MVFEAICNHLLLFHFGQSKYTIIIITSRMPCSCLNIHMTAPHSDYIIQALDLLFDGQEDNMAG